MKLLKLEVEGLRSLKTINWLPSDMNLVIGANGSGKSNLIAALQFVRRAACGDLSAAIREAGGFDAQLWDGAAERISLRIKTSPIDPERDPERDSLTYILEVEPNELGRGYCVGGELLGNFYRVETGERSEPLKLLERNVHHAVVFDEQQRALVPQDYISEQEALLSYATGPFGVNRLIAAYQKVICNWMIVKDFQVHKEARVRRPAESTPTTRLSDDGQNLVAVLHTYYTNHRDFKAAFDMAMSRVFGDDYEELVFAPYGDRYVDLRIRWKRLKREHSISGISSGVLRYIMAVTALCAPIDTALIALDEPDLALCPRMLPVLADLARKRQRSSQVVLTSSTPGLLDSFEDTPSTSVIQWDGAESLLQVLDGEALEDWLSDYSDPSQADNQLMTINSMLGGEGKRFANAVEVSPGFASKKRSASGRARSK